MIKSHFSSLTNPVAGAAAAERSTCRNSPRTRYTIITDKETTATSVAISNLRPARPQDTVGGYRQIMMDQLFGDMLDARLDELTQRENPPFLRAGAQRSAVRDAADEGRGAAAWRSSSNDGVAERAGRAGHRDAACRAFRLHGHRARARQAGEAAQLRAQRDREPRPRVGEPRRRVHAQLPPERSAADDLAGAGLSSPLPPDDHARGNQRARPRSGFPNRIGS